MASPTRVPRRLISKSNSPWRHAVVRDILVLGTWLRYKSIVMYGMLIPTAEQVFPIFQSSRPVRFTRILQSCIWNMTGGKTTTPPAPNITAPSISQIDLTTLPTELLTQITALLDPKTLLKVRQTCHALETATFDRFATVFFADVQCRTWDRASSNRLAAILQASPGLGVRIRQLTMSTGLPDPKSEAVTSLPQHLLQLWKDCRQRSSKGTSQATVAAASEHNKPFDSCELGLYRLRPPSGDNHHHPRPHPAFGHRARGPLGPPREAHHYTHSAALEL